jgi:muramoyltetrapeptide carboxypeptidase LdcA involved in peptidoglycan recycling
MALLARDDIDAIYPPWGGELAIELLERIDWAALERTRPKWLIGYSDTSTLLCTLTLRLGWASADGPCLMDLAPGQDDALTAAALDRLATPTGGSFAQQQSRTWQLHWTDFAVDPCTTYRLTEPTRWWPLGGTAQRIGFSGRLIGGCLDTLMHLAGTPFCDLPAFVRDCGPAGAIVYLENAELSPTGVVRALHQLRHSAWFEGINGLLIGRSAGRDTEAPDALRYAGALQRSLSSLRCPVLIDVDIGHRPPQFMLINGALAQVSWSAEGGGAIMQTLA